MFVGPDREVDANQGCVRCHSLEYAAWLDTHHNNSLAMPNTDLSRGIKRALRIRGALQRSELCQNCHFTVVNFQGEERAQYGVSCESCHSPGKSWVPIHSNTDRWPMADADARHERMMAAVDAGMVRPTQLYDLAENCYQCHILAKSVDGIERLANETVRTRGDGPDHHPASSEGFELVAWSHGEVRHNFRGDDGSNDASNPQSEFIRGLYVVGKMLDVEYSLRALANATDASGRFYTTIKARLEGDAGALAKLSAIGEALGDHEIGQACAAIVSAVDMSAVRPNNGAALRAMADQVQAQARTFNGRTAEALETLEEELAPIQGMLPAASAYQGEVPRPE